MNRIKYYNYIDEKLSTLCTRINKNGRLNNLELHLHSEYFYRDFLNLLYGWDLRNENDKVRNVEAIDLVDSTNKYVVQVSATNTETKIKSSLGKKSLQDYSEYTFKFISISREADQLRKLLYKTPSNLVFTPENDIVDSVTILRDIYALEGNKMETVYKFIRSQLGGDVDITRIHTNLAIVINTLAKENLVSRQKPTVNFFEIERKIEFNNLIDFKPFINEFSTYHSAVDNVYNVFDTQGSNVSISVLEKVHDFYLKNKKTKSDDALFSVVIEDIVEYVVASSNCDEIPMDEIELCVKIITVDAFIRCKIFENPNKYNYDNVIT